MLTAVAVLLQASWLQGAAPLYGKVLSQDRVPVQDARVELSCDDGYTAVTTTRPDGRFSLTPPEVSTPCSLTVSRAGFSDARRSIAAGDRNVITIELALGVVQERVTVRGAPESSFLEPIGSVVLFEDEIPPVANRGEDVIHYATSLHAARAASSAIYVDGIPASVLPPPEMIRQVTVTGGEFSPEYGDGNVATVSIATRGAARRLRVSPSGSLLAFGGGDGLRPAMGAESAHGTVSASGAIPRAPITWSMTVSRSRYAKQRAVVASVPELPGLEAFAAGRADDGAIASGRTSSLRVNGSYTASGGSRVHGAFSNTGSQADNVGVGGIVLPSAGLAMGSRGRALHLSVAAPGARFLFEGGVVARTAESLLRANSALPGLVVTGDFVAGGSAFSIQDSRRFGATGKFVVRSPSDRGWTAGVVADLFGERDYDLPNAHGVLQFESRDALAEAVEGGPTGTWSAARGDGRVAYRGTTFAPFVQRVVTRTHHVRVEAGVRADYQSGVGMALSPRVWAAAEWRGLVVQAGSGLFTRHVVDAVFVEAMKGDGAHLEQYVAADAGFMPSAVPAERFRTIRTVLAPDLTATRQLMSRVAIQRRVAGFTPSLEYTSTHDRHRLGMERTLAGGEWLDVIAADRSAAAHRVRGRIAYRWRRHSFTGIYEWLYAGDDGDGPFAYSERSSERGTEWARSSGLPPHALGIVATLSLPLGINLTADDRWQSGTPYNVTVPADPDGDGLYTHRDGRPRNGARSPEQHLLSLHGSMRARFPRRLLRLKAPEALTVRVQIDNVLNGRNYLGVGSVAGSRLFGHPLSATAGRALRVSFSVD